MSLRELQHATENQRGYDSSIDEEQSYQGRPSWSSDPLSVDNIAGHSGQLGSNPDSSASSISDYERPISQNRIKQFFARPVVLLIFVSLLSLMNYFDRGAFVGVLPLISDEFGMSDSQAGIIGGAFIVGYSLVSPFMAQLGRHVPSGILLMVGMLVWVGSTAACIFANGFWYLIVARCFTGIGEAAFICLSPALIDDVAPKTQKNRWLAIFFSTLPIGYSLGYLGAGLVAQYAEWPFVFLIESAITLPLAILCIFLPNVKSTVVSKKTDIVTENEVGHERIQEETQGLLSGEHEDETPLLRKTSTSDSYENSTSLFSTLKKLVLNHVYVVVTLGYCAQTFVLGALTFWLPDYVHNQYGLELSVSNYLIGAVTAICGIFGNVFASFLMDYLINTRLLDPRYVGISLSVLFSLLALPFAFISVFMDVISAFLVLMFCCEFLMLCTVTPVNSTFLTCVPPEIRGHSMAIATLMIHLFGDLSSPYIFGAISDRTNNQRYSLFFMSCWLIWTVIFWGLGWIFIRRVLVKEKNATR